MIRQRASKETARKTGSSVANNSQKGQGTSMSADEDPRKPLLGSRIAKMESLSRRHLATTPGTEEESTEQDRQKMENLSRKSQWIVLALASGGCAAFNGVFAKLYVDFQFP
jgi:chemotaxis response regulator CheB